MTNPNSPQPKRRLGRRGALLLAMPLALIASATIVWQASYAAFNATTDNANNTFSSGSITLGDDDSNGALFTTGQLRPTSTSSTCIKVSYGGTLASAGVKLYIAPGDLQHSAGLAPYLSSHITMTVEEGTTTGAFHDCTGFSATQTIVNGVHLDAIGTSYNTGHGQWNPGAPGDKVYKFTYLLDAAAPNTVQNQTETVKFTWETKPL